MIAASAKKLGMVCCGLALASFGVVGCGSNDSKPMGGHDTPHHSGGADSDAAGSDAAGAGGSAPDPHAGHHLPGAHANLPDARPMLPSEPWDGDLTLPSFTDDSRDGNVVEVSLTAAPASVDFGAGKPTTVWAYNGSVPGPVLRAKVGDRIVVHFKNMLPEATTIHWHGVRVPSSMDGTAATQTPVQPGASFDYEFVALDAGTFWYHPHVRSDAQVEQGLYGAIVIEDASEPLADMPAELMVLSDVLLDPDTYALDTSTDERMMMMGREGNLVLVNGKRSGVQLSVRAGEPQRFRIVNAASARFFDLMVRGGTMMRIGGDRGLLEAPETLHQLLLVSGERADVVVWADQPAQVATISAEPFERACRRRVDRSRGSRPFDGQRRKRAATFRASQGAQTDGTCAGCRRSAAHVGAERDDAWRPSAIPDQWRSAP